MAKISEMPLPGLSDPMWHEPATHWTPRAVSKRKPPDVPPPPPDHAPPDCVPPDHDAEQAADKRDEER